MSCHDMLSYLWMGAHILGFFRHDLNCHQSLLATMVPKLLVRVLLSHSDCVLLYICGVCSVAEVIV